MSKQSIQGIEGLLDQLSELDAKVQKKITRSALRAAAKPVQEDAQRRAMAFDDPGTPERVYKQINIRAMKIKDAKRIGGDLGVAIAVRPGKKAYANNQKNRRSGRVGSTYEVLNPLFYWYFLEYGTSKMAAQPFMRPAADSQQPAAFRAFRDSAWDGIKQSINAGK